MCDCEKKFTYFITFQFIVEEKVVTLDSKGNAGPKIGMESTVIEYPKQIDSVADLMGISVNIQDDISKQLNMEVKEVKIVNISRL